MNIGVAPNSRCAIKSLTIFIPIGQTGVRIQQYSILGKKGVIEKDYGPGWHRDIGPIDNWELSEKIFEQDRTYKCPTYVHRTPPCQGSCPAGEDVRGWLNIVRGTEKPGDILPIPAAFRICFRNSGQSL